MAENTGNDTSELKAKITRWILPVDESLMIKILIKTAVG